MTSISVEKLRMSPTNLVIDRGLAHDIGACIDKAVDFVSPLVSSLDSADAPLQLVKGDDHTVGVDAPTEVLRREVADHAFEGEPFAPVPFYCTFLELPRPCQLVYEVGAAAEDLNGLLHIQQSLTVMFDSSHA